MKREEVQGWHSDGAEERKEPKRKPGQEANETLQDTSRRSRRMCFRMHFESINVDGCGVGRDGSAAKVLAARA